MRTFTTVEELEAAVDETLGPTDWLEIDQARIDAFAECTEDRQWIHVDPERAADGPFGVTIAHGYLTLSLVPYFGGQLYTFAMSGPKLNYGLEKVRFPSPVRVGARVRATATIAKVQPLPAGTQVTVRYVVENEGHDKPACVAETLVLLV